MQLMQQSVVFVRVVPASQHTDQRNSVLFGDLLLPPKKAREGGCAGWQVFHGPRLY